MPLRATTGNDGAVERMIRGQAEPPADRAGMATAPATRWYDDELEPEPTNPNHRAVPDTPHPKHSAAPKMGLPGVGV